MGKVMPFFWCVVAITLNSVLGAPSIMKGVWSPEGCLVPVQDPTDKGRLLWGILDIWTDDAETDAQTLCDSPCGCYFGSNRPGGYQTAFPISNPVGSLGGGSNQPINQYPGTAVLNNGYGPNSNGGYNSAEGTYPSVVGPNRLNQYGGYLGGTSSLPNTGYGTGPSYNVPVSTAPFGYGTSNFANSQSNKEQLSIDQNKQTASSSYGSNQSQKRPLYDTGIVGIVPGVPSLYALGGSNFQNSQSSSQQSSINHNKETSSSSSGSNYNTLGVNGQRPGSFYPYNNPSGVVSASGNNYGTSNSNSEQLSINQNKETASSSSGNNFNVVDLNQQQRPAPYYNPNGGVVSGYGNQYGNSQSNSEQLSINQNKETASASSGNEFNVVGLNGLYNSGGFVSGQGSNYGSSSSNSEQLSIDQNKESSSSSSGNNFNVVGLNQQQRPGPYYNPSGVVSSTGSQYGSSESNKEQLSIDQSKESSSSSSGNNFNVVGVNGVRPAPYYNPSGVVSVSGNNYGNTNSNSEQLSINQNKETASSSSGSDYNVVGLNNARPDPYIGNTGAFVSGSGNQYGSSQSTKEQLSIDQNKESSSSSFGNNVNVNGVGPASYIGSPSGLVSATGSQYGNSQSSKEQLSIDQNKESASSSYGSNANVLGVNGVRPDPYVGGQGAFVSAGGSQFQNSQSSKEQLSIDQNKESSSSSFGNNVNVLGVNQQRPGPYYNPSGIGSVSGNSYGSSSSNSEQLSIDQNKESASSSYGSNANVLGVNGVLPGQGPYVGNTGAFVSAGGNQFENSQSSKEQLSIDQNKESSSSAFGSNVNVVGLNGVRPDPYIENPSGLVSATGSQYGNSQSSKEQLSIDQNKESSSSSSGSNVNVVGINEARPVPYIATPGSLVSASGSQFENSQSNKEQLSIEQNKESASSSSGSNVNVLGVNGVQQGQYLGNTGAFVSAGGSQFENSQSSKEQLSIDQNKESSSSAFGSNVNVVGLNGVRPDSYIENPSGLVSATGSQYGNSQSSKEQLSIEQNKESSSSSSGSNVNVVGLNEARPVPYIATPGSLDSASGSQFENSQSNKEQLSIEQNKESTSSSSGSNVNVLGVNGVQQGQYLGNTGAFVSAGGSEFENSQSSKEQLSLQQNKESSTSSSGSNVNVLGVNGVRPDPYVGNTGAFVSASGSQYGNSESSKEQLSLNQNKESSSSSFGNSGVTNFNQPVIPYGVNPSSVVSVSGNEAGSSQYNNEHLSIDQSKESGSQSSGSQFTSLGNAPYISGPTTIVGSGGIVASGNQFSNSQQNKESLSLNQQSQSASSSSGSDFDLLASGSNPVPVRTETDCSRCKVPARRRQPAY